MPVHAADLAAGKAKADDVCADEDHRAGARSMSAKMAGAAKKLSAADVANLAACHATLK